MQLTGRNLQLARDGVSQGIFWLRNEIATCPDVNLYAADLDEIEQEIAEHESLLARMDRAIAKEQARAK